MNTESSELRSRLLRGAHRTLTGLHPVLESILAALLGLLVGAILMYIYGYDPWKAYTALFMGAFGRASGWATALARSMYLTLTALTFSICVRGGMFNIGAEGQLYMGALAATTIAYFALPPGLHHIVGIIIGMLAGAAWSIIPALLKITRGVSEVISTIMFNWIARFAAIYMVAHVLTDPLRSEKTISIPVTARFPILIQRTELSAGVFATVAFALIIYFILWHTVIGYEVRAAGLNPTAARYGGIKSRRTMLLAFIFGGLAAGLAGALIVMATPPSYAINSGLGQLADKGFAGMAASMVGRNHPIGIIFAAIFFGGLEAGSRWMQIKAGVPLDMVRIVMGTIVLMLAIPELFRLFPAIKNQFKRGGQMIARLARRSEGGGTK